MTLNALRVSTFIGATALALLVAAAPAGAWAQDNAYGARHYTTHGRTHHYVGHRYGYRYGPANVVGGAGALAGEAAGGLFDGGVTAWDALDCTAFGYYCRR
jgi:hypothetical protein